MISLANQAGDYHLTIQHQNGHFRYERLGHKGVAMGSLNLSEGYGLEDIRRALSPNLRFMPPPQDKHNQPVKPNT